MSHEDMVNKLLEELNRKVNEIEEIYMTLQTISKYGADIQLPDFNVFYGVNTRRSYPQIW